MIHIYTYSVQYPIDDENIPFVYTYPYTSLIPI